MRRKKKSTAAVVILTVIGVLAAALGLLAYAQRGNLKALRYVSKYSSDELSEKSEKLESEIQSVIEILPEISITPLDEEQRRKLASGELSREDALNLLTGKTAETTASETTAEPVPGTDAAAEKIQAESRETEKTAETPEKTVETPENTTAATTEQTSAQPDMAYLNDEINRVIAEIYLLKAEFLNSIDDLIAAGQEERLAIPKPERTLSVKLNMAAKYAGLGNALEKDCDKQMEALLSELEGLLKLAKSDTTIPAQIRAIYNEEKAIKKARLMDSYWPKV